MTNFLKPKYCFHRTERITRQQDFDRCKSKGKRFLGKRFVLVHFIKDKGPKRLGVIVTKKTGGAVIRNQWRRMIRESFRLKKRELPAYCDEIIIVKKAVKGKPDPEAKAELTALFLRACML